MCIVREQAVHDSIIMLVDPSPSPHIRISALARAGHISALMFTSNGRSELTSFLSSLQYAREMETNVISFERNQSCAPVHPQNDGVDAALS
jgi:hypothetical protein